MFDEEQQTFIEGFNAGQIKAIDQVESIVRCLRIPYWNAPLTDKISEKEAKAVLKVLAQLDEALAKEREGIE